MRYFAGFFISLVVLIGFNCNNDNIDPPEPPLELSVLVTWDHNTESDLAFYNVYCGRTDQGFVVYKNIIDTFLVVEDRIYNQPYVVGVTAIDTAHNESNMSHKVYFRLLKDGVKIDSIK